MSVTHKRESILRKNPYRKRRSFVARAMALTPIGDIANGGMTKTQPSETVTWSTATDWDNAVSESGVVHESFGDLPGAGTVQLGYPSFDRNGTALQAYYPSDVDTGSTLPDVSGNNNDGSITGATLGSTALNNTTAINYDGVDDFTDLFSSGYSAWTFSCWIKAAAADFNDSYGAMFGPSNQRWASGTIQFFVRVSDGVLYHDAYDLSSSPRAVGTTNVLDNAWHHVAATYDGSQTAVWVDGAQDTSTSASGSSTSILHQSGAVDNAGGQRFAGIIEDFRIYTRALSSSEISALSDAGTSGSLTTATKTFSASTKPDLQNLTYSLNGDSISLDVIGSPGTASEEIVTQSLGGASSYNLSWTNSHTDFRVKINLSTTSVTSSPTISQIELVTP